MDLIDEKQVFGLFVGNVELRVVRMTYIELIGNGVPHRELDARRNIGHTEHIDAIGYASGYLLVFHRHDKLTFLVRLFRNVVVPQFLKGIKILKSLQTIECIVLHVVIFSFHT